MTPVTPSLPPLPPLLRELAARLPGEPPVWLVGGAVRDLLLGRPVQDLDLVVPRGALALARRLADELGAAFVTLDEGRGVGRMVWERDGRRVEVDVADFRAGDLVADLRARDLTINAMALPLGPATAGGAAIVDPAGGRADLERGVVRLLGPEVLADDPLRGLRAVRIAAQLGFALDGASRDWIRAAAPRLAEAAPERSRDELWKCLVAPAPAATLRQLDEPGLLRVLVPEVEAAHGVEQSPPHVEDVWQHTLAVVDRTAAVIASVRALASDAATTPLAGIGSAMLVPFAPLLVARLDTPLAAGHRVEGHLLLAALLHDLGKPRTRSVDPDGRIHFYGHETVGAELAAARLLALRFAQAEVQWVVRAVRHHMRPLQLQRPEPLPARTVHRFHRAAGEVAPEVCLLALADNLAKGEGRTGGAWPAFVARLGELLDAFFFHHQELVAPPPLLRGGELIAEVGLAPGPAVRELMAALAEAQASGGVADREQALSFARRWARQRGLGTPSPS